MQKIHEIESLFFYFLLYILLSGCNHHYTNFYNETDYILVRTDSSDRGLERKLYVYKNDSSRKMIVNYFYDGKILGKGFFYKGKEEGNLEIYDNNGKLFVIDSFHNGVKISSKRFYAPGSSSEFFRNGKPEPVTTSDIDSLLK